MVDFAIRNAWDDFKVANALLTSPSLSIRWEGNPYALSSSHLATAAAAGLYFNLLTVFEAAIDVKLSVEERSESGGSLRERLGWLDSHGYLADGEVLAPIADIYEMLFYRELKVRELNLEGIPEEERAEFADAQYRRQTTGGGRPKFNGRHARQILPRIVGAVEHQLVAWGLIEDPKTYRLDFAERHSIGSYYVEPLTDKNFGVRMSVVSEADDEDGPMYGSFTSVPIRPETIDWSAILAELEQRVEIREGFNKGTATRIADAAVGKYETKWIKREVPNMFNTVSGEVTAMTGIAAGLEGEVRARADAIVARLEKLRATLSEMNDEVAAMPDDKSD